MLDRSVHAKKGFTLIEIILYVAVFAIVAALMVVILTTALQVGSRESSSAEVSAQLHFATQTIQRLVRSSSNIDIQAGVPTSVLRLRMPDPNQDPTVISLSGTAILMKQGSSPTSSITTSRVVVDALSFEKITQYPGHDTVSIDLTVRSNNSDPKAQVIRSISSAIARVSAATFDSDVLPGGPPYAYNIGQSGSPWQNAYLSGVLNLGVMPVDPPIAQNGAIYYNTASGTFRGYQNNAWSNIGSGPWTVSGNNVYNTNTGNVGIGTVAPSQKLEIAGNLRLPTSTASQGVIMAGPDRFIHNYGSQDTFLGINAGNLSLGGSGNTGVGYNALQNLALGNYNTALGSFALTANNSGSYNSAMGYNALKSNTNGNANIAIGGLSLNTNSSGGDNIGVGFTSLTNNTTGDRNIAIGSGTGFYNTIGGSNVFIGGYTGASNISGSNNILLGAGADVGASALTNAIAIGNGAIVGASNSLVLGGITATSSVNVGIGLTTPAAKLEIKGGNFYNTTGGNGIILKSPNGAICALITINNGGGIATSTVACPD